MEKITIKQVIQRLNTSRATLYKYLRQCNMQTIKEKNKSYLTIEQVEKIREAIKNNKPEKKQKTEVSKTVQTLKKELETEKIKSQKLKIEKDKYVSENESLKTKNIQLKTRAEVLDEQNKKIIFQMGATAEKMAMIQSENQKMIEITTKNKKSGIFRHIFRFWKK